MDNLSLQILERLNSLYTNAFNQLLIYTIGLVAFVGAVIPLIITYIQNRSFRREQQTITKELQDEAKRIREELKQNLREDLLKDIAESEKRLSDALTKKDIELTKKISNADAGVFHVQGTVSRQATHYGLAVQDFTLAAAYYLIGEDELNLQRVLRSVLDMLKKVDKNELALVDKVYDTINSLIKALSAHNINGRYTDMINSIERELNEAKKREPKTAVVKT